MRIIKRGYVKETIYFGTCPKCGCEIECNQREAHYSRNPQPGKGCLVVVCPMGGCDDTIVVNQKPAPSGSA